MSKGTKSLVSQMEKVNSKDALRNIEEALMSYAERLLNGRDVTDKKVCKAALRQVDKVRNKAVKQVEDSIFARTK